MATSSSYSFDLTAAEIIRDAFRLAGIVDMGRNPSANQQTGARSFLNAIYKALQNEGIILHAQEMDTVTLTTGTASYVTDADTMDVIFPGPYVTNTAGTSSQVKQMTSDEYMGIADKTTRGVPTQLYVEKRASTTLYLYPVPDDTVTSLTFYRQRLLRDVDNGGVTQDLPSRFTLFVVTELAHRIALSQSLPASKCGYLRDEAMRLKIVALGNDNEHGNVQFSPMSTGGWR